MQKQAIVIGAGFSGLAAAASLGQKGFQVTVIEKHSQPGGRCRTWQKDGFTFDMGPSWYWMPDVFETFYNRFNHTTSDFYELVRLNPSYRVVFEQESADIPADYAEFCQLLEKWESGSSLKLTKFMNDAQYKYEVGMRDFVYKPSFSLFEFADFRLAKSALRLNLFNSIQQEIRSLFSDERIRKLLEFPVLFLGAKPSNTPALYSLMNYADIKLGTWYPMGGMHEIAKAFAQIAVEQGVTMKYEEQVINFEYANGKVSAVVTDKNTYENIDVVISGADYHHTESLLPTELQSYDDAYWNSRQLSPSSLLVYVGVNKKIENLKHHTLFFDAEFEHHAEQIYDDPAWPKDPLFYVCAPSKTDASVAPTGCENLFFLMPIAPDLEGDEVIYEQYFETMLSRLEKQCGEEIKESILFKRFFCVQDFKETYNSFKGNAYGLANTLKQTAILKPSMRSRKLKNLFYCGQLTVPGPGVPPSIISGQVIADYISKKGVK